jgi:membrane-bound ClpP family serine protease
MTTAPPTSETQYRNGLGVSALILGVVALALAWIPIVNYLAVVIGLVGLVLAIVGLVRVRRRGANNPVVTVLGGALSVVAIVLSFVFFFAFVAAVDEGVRQLDEEIQKSIEEFEEEAKNTEAEMDAYFECVDAIDLEDPDFEAKMAACDEG